MLRDGGFCLELERQDDPLRLVFMAHCSSKDRPKLLTEKERPQMPAFPNEYIGHSCKSVPNERNHSCKSVPNEWG